MGQQISYSDSKPSIQGAQSGDLWVRKTGSALYVFDSGAKDFLPITVPGVIPQTFQAVGNGIADDRAPLANAAAAIPDSGGDLYLVGIYLIKSNITFGSNVRLVFAHGSMLRPATGVAVTINGPIQAPLSKIFDLVGTGLVGGFQQVEALYPQWWGAKGDNVTDDTTAVQATLNAAAAALNPSGSGGHKIVFNPGKYLLGNLTLIATGSTPIYAIAIVGTVGSGAPVVWKYNGGGSGTILEMQGVIYSRIENLVIDGNAKTAGIGIFVHAKDSPPVGSFEVTLTRVRVTSCATGIQLGTSTNTQASEFTLKEVIVDNCTIGYDIEGQNSLNIRGYGIKSDANATGLKIVGGNIVAYDTLFTNSTVVDISLSASQRACALYGGDSEGSVQHLSILSAATNFIFIEEDFSVSLTGAAGGTVLSDGSLAWVSLKRCSFINGGKLSFSGFNPASGRVGIKRIEDCVFAISNLLELTPASADVILHGNSGSIYIVYSGRPLGVVAKPFSASPNLCCPWNNANFGATAAPVASTDYTIDGTDVILNSTGGTGVSWSIKDPAGTVIESGLATLTNKRVPLGYIVNAGAFSVAPTVTAWFVQG